ncbi:MAG: apolipoprotein N-acyltransferase [Betaproteobacteria bacterium]|nr:apolipoprotein N-acyltransferase [Betaproteobacteria bacterium]
MIPSAWARAIAAFVCGAVMVLGFAPLRLFLVPVLGTALLFSLVSTEDRPRRSAVTGFAFGLGLFAAGIGWIYVALHTYGGMPPWLAAVSTLVFASFLALFPAIACAATAWFPRELRWAAFAPLWVLTEWLRSWIFTGFPWLSLGYSQIPASPLSGLAPLLGLFGVTYAVVQTGACLVALLSGRSRGAPAVVLVGIVAVAIGSSAVQWTRPDGPEITVSLVQGNVAQDLKFREDRLIKTLTFYEAAVLASKSRLTILPETALPLFVHEIPPAYLQRLKESATSRKADVIVGVFENDPVGSDRYFNAVISLGDSPTQTYRKHHLVPFGEFIPLKTFLAPIINDWLHIPLADQTPGAARQPPLRVAGERIAMDICYEDVFGREIIRSAPEATILANVSNDAWYGRSWAAEQHLQIAQMRALESGRWMLRATNTGVTAIIDETGHVRKVLRQFEAGVLEGVAQGRTGETPYVRTGNAAVVVLCTGTVFTLWSRRRPGRRNHDTRKRQA